MEKVRNDLLKMQDIEYKEFHSRLIPNIPKEQIIGIRIPILRKYVKTLKDKELIEEFMKDVPHMYYEENNVHAFLIEKIQSYDQCVEKLEQFLPYVDNWATCDSMSPKILKSEKEKLIEQAITWMKREEEYTVRFGIKILMDVFLDEDFKEEYLYQVARIQREEYYIKMMQSWYIATALVKQYETTIQLLESRLLTVWVHNKAIQKAIESYRITKERKDYLRTLKRKIKEK